MSREFITLLSIIYINNAHTSEWFHPEGGSGMPTLTAKLGELAKSYIPKCYILLVCPILLKVQTTGF